MPDNRPCQLSRKHYRVFGIIFSHFPSPPRRSPLPFFFRFLKCQTHRFSQPVRPIFPSLPSPPRRQAAILVKIDVPPQTDENFAFPYEKLFFREKIEKNIFNQASFDGLYGRFLPNIRIHRQHLYFPCP